MDKIADLESRILDVSGEEGIRALNELARAYLHVLPEKTLEYGARALELASELDNTKEEAIALRNIGTGHTVLGDHGKAKDYYFRSLRIAEEADYKEEIADCLNSIAAVHNRLSDNELALEFYLKSATLYEEIGNRGGVARVLNNIGTFYFQVFHDYEKALEYYLEALGINEDAGNKLATAINLSNIGEVHIQLDDYEKGLQYSLESLRVSEEIDNKRAIVLSLANIGEVYSHWKDNERALENFLESLEVSKKVGDKYLISTCLMNIEKAHRAKGNHAETIKYLEESLELAKELGEKDLIKDVYESLSESHLAAGDYRKALEYHKLYSEMLSEVFNDASSKRIAEMQTKYETERKEKEAEIYRLRNVDLVEANDQLREAREEVERSFENLTIAHSRLKEMQNQIIRQEKMASLGQLVAGIAHEINNPVNFIYSGVKPLRDRINEIFLVLDKYKELELIGDSKELSDLANQIHKLKREISFETTVGEIEELLETIYDGANRTAKIVRDLQRFSRDRRGVIENININKHIDSTLSLLRNQYKNRIKILREYTEDLMIECYSGQINRVLMNILSNAIQAIEDVGEIRIRTYGEDKYIFIVVSDTGKGIAEGDILRIFDPFFTTKAVGKGTGLGLSISYEIIKNHQGDIRVKSELGKGSEFTIELPVRQD